MKYLSNYIQDKQTKLFNDCGAFFAFSNKQVDDQKTEGVTYVSMGGGLICPKDRAKELHEGLNSIAQAGMTEDMAENGKKCIIHRELGNHEYCITYDISDTVNKLSGYGITAEEVQAETADYMKDYYAGESQQLVEEVNA